MTISPGSDGNIQLHAQIEKFWKGKMFTFSEKIMSRYSLSSDSKSFLGKIGLPEESPLLVEFYTGNDVLKPLTYKGNTYYGIGHDGGARIALKAGTEDVWTLDPTNNLPQRFINSSIRQFVEFLFIYSRHQEELRSATDEDVGQIVSRMRSEFGRMDIHALENEENWWSLILEQTEQGLL